MAGVFTKSRTQDVRPPQIYIYVLARTPNLGVFFKKEDISAKNKKIDGEKKTYEAEDPRFLSKLPPKKWWKIRTSRVEIVSPSV